MNIIYAYMAVASHMGTTNNMVQVSAQMKRYVVHIVKSIKVVALAPFFDDPIFLNLTGIPGPHKGGYSDSSGGKVEWNKGWIVQTNTIFVERPWSSQTNRALKHKKKSISPSELLSIIPLLHLDAEEVHKQHVLNGQFSYAVITRPLVSAYTVKK